MAGQADGSIKFDTKIDDSGITNAGSKIASAFKKIGESIKNAFSGSAAGAEKITAETEKSAEAAQEAAEGYDEQAQAIAEINEEMERLQQEREALEKRRKELQEAEIPYFMEGKRQDALDANQKAIDENQKKMDELAKKAAKVQEQIEKDAPCAVKECEPCPIDEAGKKADDLNQKMKNTFSQKIVKSFGKAVNGVKDRFAAFGSKVAGFLKNLIVYSAILGIFKKMKETFIDLAKSDKQVGASLARIKGNLLTAFQPIYEFLIPYLRKFLQVLEYVTARAAQLMAILFGKNVKDMAKNAKALNDNTKAIKKEGKAAKEASRSLAAFDELNQLGSDDKDSGSGSDDDGIGVDFSGTSDLGELDKKTKMIATYGSLILGTCLLVAGIFLVNIPMIVAGIALVYTGLALGEKTGAFAETPNWVKQIITWGSMIVGVALIVAGILIVNIPMVLAGISLVAVGVAYGKSSGAFEQTPPWLRTILTWGARIYSVVMIILGIATFNLPMVFIGIKAMDASVKYGQQHDWFDAAWASIKKFFADMWEHIKNWWENIKEWFNTKVKPIFTAEWWHNFFNGIWTAVQVKWNSIKVTIKTIVSDIKSSVINTFNNIKESIARVWDSVKTKTLSVWQSIKDGIKSVVNSIIGHVEGFVNKILYGINWLIVKLNNLTAKMPDWVLEHTPIGKFHLNQLEYVKLPRLASGTVIPANYGEFAAVLGDNKREAEVVSPLSTMKEAMKQALIESGGGNEIQNITITLANRTISEAVIEYVNGRTKQLGVSVIKGV